MNWNTNCGYRLTEEEKQNVSERFDLPHGCMLGRGASVIGTTANRTLTIGWVNSRRRQMLCVDVRNRRSYEEESGRWVIEYCLKLEAALGNSLVENRCHRKWNLWVRSQRMGKKWWAWCNSRYRLFIKRQRILLGLGSHVMPQAMLYTNFEKDSSWERNQKTSLFFY